MDEEDIQSFQNLVDDKNFHLKIELNGLANSLVRSILYPQSEPHQLLREVQKNISNLGQKSVYTSLKYLMFMHEALHVCRTELQCSNVR